MKFCYLVFDPPLFSCKIVALQTAHVALLLITTFIENTLFSHHILGLF